MQVQSIQANQTTNNCRKPCFKAHFVNDVNGNFRHLWETSNKDKVLEQKIEAFASKYKEHALEIIGVKDGSAYVGSGWDRQQVFGRYYKLFNHFNGKFFEYFVNSLDNARLFNLLNNIEKDDRIFTNDYTAKPYRYLTGQEEPREMITITDDGKLITEK